MKETTGEQFDLFVAECKRWLDYFGLKQWQVHYDIGDMDRTLADVTYDTLGMVATMRIAKERSNLSTSDYEIKRSAFHEVCELLLAKMNFVANARYVQEDEIDIALHEIIRTLENTVFNNAEVVSVENAAREV